MSRTAFLATAAVLVAVAAVVLLALGGEDGGGQAREPVRADELPPPAATEAAGPGAALGDPARLRAGGRDLLPAGEGDLEGLAGEAVQGEQLEVLGVTERGFFVGSSELDRVYVQWLDDPPVVRTRVDLEGVVRAAPGDSAALELEGGDAAVVARQGGFVDAREVTPSG